jgi:hypothetical protein
MGVDGVRQWVNGGTKHQGWEGIKDKARAQAHTQVRVRDTGQAQDRDDWVDERGGFSEF